MKLLFLTKYGSMAASTRYRFSQFIPVWEKAGIQCTLSPLLGDDYLESRLLSGRIRLLPLARGLARRASATLLSSRFDKVVVHYEALPYLPAWLERVLRLRGIPYIYDFDDAIFHQYDHHPNHWVRFLYRNKIKRVIAGARTVFAGNEYLAAYAREVNLNVHLVPTVVDLSRYTIRERSDTRSQAGRDGVFTIGWIGSPSTARYLHSLAEPLGALAREFPLRLILVGSGPIELPGVPTEIRQWSERNEVRDIQDFDVGVMPLPDTHWARGKCGFKLIQYMACGVPAIGSPVGANLDIIEQGKSGYLASSHDEWITALKALRESPELRSRMGVLGRERVRRHYSFESLAPRLTELVRS